MSDGPAFEPRPWRVKQILDPETEKEASDSVIQMIFDYEPASVAHIIFSNHTWDSKILHKYLAFYENLTESITSDIQIIARNCDPFHFQTYVEKHSINNLPIYINAVDMSTIDAKCQARTFPDPHEYLTKGSASTEELFEFVLGVMSDVLKVFFSPKEIKRMLKDLKLIESLENCRNRDDEIGWDVDKKFEYEIIKVLKQRPINLPNYIAEMSHSITHFLVFFALHTIRENCFVSFGMDRELKFFQRDMHGKAVEDFQNAKARMSNGATSVKKEKMSLGVKREKRVSSSDDDIEIIDLEDSQKSSSSKKAKNNGEGSSGSTSNQMESSEQDYPEKEMMMSLEKEPLPMVFKTKFRKLVEQNRDMRDEINDYKNLIKLFLKEKNQKLN